MTSQEGMITEEVSAMADEQTYFGYTREQLGIADIDGGKYLSYNDPNGILREGTVNDFLEQCPHGVQQMAELAINGMKDAAHFMVASKIAEDQESVRERVEAARKAAAKEAETTETIKENVTAQTEQDKGTSFLSPWSQLAPRFQA